MGSVQVQLILVKKRKLAEVAHGEFRIYLELIESHMVRPVPVCHAGGGRGVVDLLEILCRHD